MTKNRSIIRRTTLVGALAAALAVLALPASAIPAAANHIAAGTVYTISNDASGNAVLAFHRAPDGSLSAPRTFPTGGLGTGAGLGSQGAVTLSGNGRFLLAVDAASD